MEAGKTTTTHDEEEEQKSCIYAAQLAHSSVLPMVLNSVIQLEVFKILAKAGPNVQLSASEIVSQMAQVKNPDAAFMLDRMLSLLVGYSVLTCSVDDGHKLYGLTPVAKYLDGDMLGPLMALHHDTVCIQSWFELKNAVLEGGVPFERTHGIHSYEYASRDPRLSKVFNKAMIGYSNIVMKQVLERYKGFGNLNNLVDVGGGLGIELGMIISKYPNIKGINLDLPHVINDAQPHPGLEHVGGDMFERIPDGDAIFLKWIIHNWSDEQCLKLLKNCYKALPENGKIIVVEGVLPVKPEKTASYICTSQVDAFMMTQSPGGGRERTEKEFLTLARGAGFRAMKMCCLACNFWVMEFYK